MLWRVLRRYLRAYKKEIGIVAGLQLVSVIATLFLPSINGHIIDRGVATGDTAYIVEHGGLMLAFSAFQIVAAIDYGKGADAKREVRTILQDVIVLATGVNIVNQLPRRFEIDANGKTINRVNLSGSTSFNTITIEHQLCFRRVCYAKAIVTICSNEFVTVL